MRIGVDTVSISQVAHSLAVSTTFVAKVFGPVERKSAEGMSLNRSIEFLAGRFAVKEAVLKAMRIGLAGPVALCDIETTRGEDGCPRVQLSASALYASHSLSLSEWQVSITHENHLVTAFVVAY
jgi:holo-[acyl-carrier protein] synthase